MIAERTLDHCIFCGDCIEVCPHGALGETPNFELSFFNRFGPDVTLEKGDLAVAPTISSPSACRAAKRNYQ